MKNLKYFVILAFSVISLSSMQAQKFGVINSTELLMAMPTVKSADSQLETYQKQLIAQGQEMVKKFEAKYQTYITEANGGGLSKIQMQEREGVLAKEQQAIQQFEVEVQQKLVAKRETIYKPILDRVNTAVNAVGDEGGYTMIFDSSTGTILHHAASENVMAQVKAKLGI